MIRIINGRRSKIDKNSLGGKGYYLKKMEEKKLPVVPGIILANSVVKQIIDFVHLNKKYNRGRKFPNDLKKKILESLSQLKLTNSPLIVRSSFTQEDSAKRSYAGLFLTLPNVSLRKLWDSIVMVISSYFSGSTEIYQNEKEVKNSPGAVIIQKFLKTDYAGTLFTINPNTGEDKFLIEYTKGLGERVVSGKINPKRIEVSKKIDSKEFAATSGISTLLPRLLKYANVIEREVIHGPADIEWGAKDGKIYIFQARPITGFTKSYVANMDLDTNYIEGIGASEGIATGTAVILKKYKNKTLSKSNIVISKYLSYNKDFANVGGIVTEFGGLTSHAAVLAREIRVPCVVGVRNATKIIKDGEIIKIDGTLGRVYIKGRVLNKLKYPEEATDLTLDIYPAKVYKGKYLIRVGYRTFFKNPSKYILVKNLNKFKVVYAPSKKILEKNAPEILKQKNIIVDYKNFDILPWSLYKIQKLKDKNITIQNIRKSITNLAKLKHLILYIEKLRRRFLVRSMKILEERETRRYKEAFECIQNYFFLSELKYSIIPKGYALEYLRKSFNSINKNGDLSFEKFLSMVDSNKIKTIDIKNSRRKLVLKHLIEIYKYIKKITKEHLRDKEDTKAQAVWRKLCEEFKQKGIDLEALLRKKFGIVYVNDLDV